MIKAIIQRSAVAGALLTLTATMVVAPTATAAPLPYKPPTPPAPIAYTPGSLTFTQFNVCKTQCAAPAPSWEVRRDRVERVLIASDADVIGINEATNYATSRAKTQWDDIQIMMAAHGYTAVKATADECARPRDENGRLTGPSPCEHTTGLLYNTATVTEINTPSGSASSGASMISSISPGVSADSGAREVNWGFLQAKDGSTPPFLAISMHLTTVKDAVHENDRVATANALAGWSAAKVAEAGLPANTPVVLMADLNSYQKRQPQGAQKVLTNTGWTDAYPAAQTLINGRYSSINETPKTSPWGPKPYFFYSLKNPVTRIDYIFTKNATPVSYETMLWTTPQGNFIPEYQASDHNAIRAVVKF